MNTYNNLAFLLTGLLMRGGAYFESPTTNGYIWLVFMGSVLMVGAAACLLNTAYLVIAPKVALTVITLQSKLAQFKPSVYAQTAYMNARKALRY